MKSRATEKPPLNKKGNLTTNKKAVHRSSYKSTNKPLSCFAAEKKPYLINKSGPSKSKPQPTMKLDPLE